MSQTFSSNILRVTTRFACRIKYSSKRNSAAAKSIDRPSRATLRCTRSIFDGTGEQARRSVGRPSGGHPDARQEFLEGEGLDQVIVSARLQSLHPVIDAAHRGQVNHRGHSRLVAQRLDQFQTGHAGKHRSKTMTPYSLLRASFKPVSPLHRCDTE